MGKYTVWIVAFCASLVSSIALGAGVENLGNAPVVASDESANKTLTPPHQNIQILYEHDKSAPRWDYANNKQAFMAIAKMVERLSEAGSKLEITISGSASPVGNESYNRSLALRRAKALRDAISRMKGGDRFSINVMSMGEDWSSFIAYVEQHYNGDNRSDVLAILRADISDDAKEKRLKALDKGKTWDALCADYMPSARNAVIAYSICDVVPNVPEPKAVEQPKVVEQPKTVEPKVEPTPIEQPKTVEPKVEEKAVEQPKIEEPKPAQEPKPAKQPKPEKPIEPRKIVMAARTNLLVPALNVGVEVPIGTNWSVGADYYYPWIWPKADNKNCFEFLGWGIEGRYWFGKERTVFDRLQGHSVGIYSYMGYYDFERNYHGHQGEFINVGADYTFAMAVGKRKSVHFEFSLGVGFIYSQARRYTVIPDHGVLISDKYTKHVRYFGPTKANVSLVVPIFKKVKPNDKTRHSDE